MQNEPSRLATKLRQEYRNRGENLRGIGATSTEELMHRAQMGRDPRENVSAEAMDDRLRYRRQTGYTAQDPYAQSHSYSPQHTTSHTAPKQERQNNRRTPPPKQKAHAPAEDRQAGEVRVRGREFPVGYFAMLAVVTMMIMGILFSISQVYQTTGTIADLERELVTLQAEADELELAIEEKNDIRIIEQIATDQLGMVKEDSVQRKYISLSDGERIDLIGDNTETVEESTLGTMLSSLAAAFAGFFENLGN